MRQGEGIRSACFRLYRLVELREDFAIGESTSSNSRLKDVYGFRPGLEMTLDTSNKVRPCCLLSSQMGKMHPTKRTSFERKRSSILYVKGRLFTSRISTSSGGPRITHLNDGISLITALSGGGGESGVP